MARQLLEQHPPWANVGTQLPAQHLPTGKANIIRSRIRPAGGTVPAPDVWVGNGILKLAVLKKEKQHSVALIR